jgi:hypothetical protein
MTPPTTPSQDLKAAAEASTEGAPSATGSSAPAPQQTSSFFTAGHEALFDPVPLTCDACDGPLRRDDDGDDEAAGGHGLYIWARSAGIVYEEPPLCPACAAAITISALQRWDIEEEEG